MWILSRTKLHLAKITTLLLSLMHHVNSRHLSIESNTIINIIKFSCWKLDLLDQQVAPRDDDDIIDDETINAALLLSCFLSQIPRIITDVETVGPCSPVVLTICRYWLVEFGSRLATDWRTKSSFVFSTSLPSASLPSASIWDSIAGITMVCVWLLLSLAVDWTVGSFKWDVVGVARLAPCETSLTVCFEGMLGAFVCFSGWTFAAPLWPNSRHVFCMLRRTYPIRSAIIWRCSSEGVQEVMEMCKQNSASSWALQRNIRTRDSRVTCMIYELNSCPYFKRTLQKIYVTVIIGEPETGEWRILGRNCLKPDVEGNDVTTHASIYTQPLETKPLWFRRKRIGFRIFWRRIGWWFYFIIYMTLWIESSIQVAGRTRIPIQIRDRALIKN